MIKVNKVWVIVYRINNGIVELLALKPNPEPGMSTDYYVVTGAIENGENSREAAIREVNEEIGVRPKDAVRLNQTITYIDRFSGREYIEECFAAQIDQFDLKLNEEHIAYRWMTITGFTKTIWWEDAKDKLEDIILSFKDVVSSNS